MNTNDVAIQESFLHELKELSSAIEKNTRHPSFILGKLCTTKDVATILNAENPYKLCHALEGVYRSLADKKITFSENVLSLINIVGKKLGEQGIFYEDSGIIERYVEYCDKAAAGEIFKTKELSSSVAPTTSETAISIPNKYAQISFSEVNKILTTYEELTARTFKIFSELEQLERSSVKEQLFSDVRFLQSKISEVHKQLFLTVQDDEFFLSNHQGTYGFFVYANEKKYFITTRHIIDIICTNPQKYVYKNGQRFLFYDVVDESAEVAQEKIPVYSLSSLFTTQKATAKADTDTILIASYLNQKIGIVVDAVERFASLAKKSLPPAFASSKMLRGFVFDEHYDMIVILSVPEILRRFRSQRIYDVKMYETNTRRREHKVLVVNDSSTTRQIIETALKANGFSVGQAVDGISAIESLKAQHYDLIITDDDMPRMGGAILVDNVRRMEAYKNIPVIVMAASPIDKADAFISKDDFRRNDLIELIRKFLDG